MGTFILLQYGIRLKTTGKMCRQKIETIFGCAATSLKQSGNRNQGVIMATTDSVKGVTLDDKAKKPALLKLYDYTKSGTDIMDQRMARRKYSSKAKSNRWTMVGFSYLLDTAWINVQTIWSLNNGLDPRRANSFNFGINVLRR